MSGIEGRGRLRRYAKRMLAATEHSEAGRGAARLLAHCAAVERLSTGRRPAYARLEDAVGGDLARLLVGALAAAHRGVPRDLVC